MGDSNLIDWIDRSLNNKILLSFSIPKTPTQVKNELGINKFSLKPFLKRKLVECLNPDACKGRFYGLTDEANKLLRLPTSTSRNKKDYNLMGFIIAGTRQRYVILRTLSLNPMKRTSEEIRIKSSNLNSCLSRISTKSILKELINKGLVETEMGDDQRRNYWISEEGKSLASELY